jgi:hypothetical protein
VESDYHHTLLRGENPVDYKPTYVQEGVAASALPREFVPVQLVVQQVQIQGGPDCLAMFHNGSQTTLVLNSYAKEAKLKKIGASRIRVRGIGAGALEPNHVFEVPMVKLSGGIAKVRAHGVDHVLGDLLKLDFSPAKQAFVSIPEKEVVAHHGLVKLLVGLDHLYLHPVEVERTGSLALHISMFGIKTGWIISGNLAAAARNTAWAGAVRNYHYVPLDFLSAEALGTEPLRRCSACMKCKECQFRASVLTFKANAEYEG